MKYDVFNRFNGDVQFTAEIDCNDDTSTSVQLGLSVKWALKNSVNLSDADLIGADLSGANLSDANLRDAYLLGADLSGANLSDAYLRGADLSDANLSDADLSGANLSDAYLLGADLLGADLSDANLSGADLSGANLRGADLLVYQTDIWTCYIHPESIRIGCQYHSAETWQAMADEEIGKMDNRALDWWKKHKTAIFAIHATL
jgi:hypothetical protein